MGGAGGGTAVSRHFAEESMCGIAGLIHRGKSTDIGDEMTRMLQSLKHRGPDSTGFALYGVPDDDKLVMRFKVAEQEDLKGYEIHGRIKHRKAQVEERLAELGAKVLQRAEVTEYASRYQLEYGGELRELASFIEDLDGVEILSLNTPSATRAWQPSPTWTSAPRIPTGPTRSATSPSCTTASSPTTGAFAGNSSAVGTVSCRTAIPN
jgi:hypothetical protein